MFTYQNLMDDIRFLSFAGVDTGSIGLTEGGNEIPYLHYGNYTGRQIIVTGGIHARENVSCIMVIRQAYRLIQRNLQIPGGIYFVPMVNVDGALLIEKGAACFPGQEKFLKKVNAGADFSLWKANINAVDLNTNFDARFGSGIQNKKAPSPSDYTGPFAFSESETRALAEFTCKVQPALTVSYHALGREIYWYFHQSEEACVRDERICSAVNSILGYKKIDDAMGSAGGYKDWCIQTLHIPALTIELGDAEYRHPLCEDQIEDDWFAGKDLPEQMLQILQDTAAQ